MKSIYQVTWLDGWLWYVLIAKYFFLCRRENTCASVKRISWKLRESWPSSIHPAEGNSIVKLVSSCWKRESEISLLEVEGVSEFPTPAIMGDSAEEGNLIHSILNDLKVGFLSYSGGFVVLFLIFWGQNWTLMLSLFHREALRLGRFCRQSE